MKFRSILNHIANDEIESAIETFESFFKTTGDFKNQLLLVQANLKNLKQRESTNVISEADLAIGKSKVRKSILDLFTQIEAIMEASPDDIDISKQGANNKSQTVLKIIQDVIADKGYNIISQIYSDQSSYYFKAKRNSFIQKDFYVIQVLNWYKLNNSWSGYNQKYLDFFSRCPHPFVDLIEFHPGNPSYIIRKYAQGIDLHDLLLSGIKLSLLKGLEAIITISKGLNELNDAGIFYNNLIPDQIILSSTWDLYILPLDIFEENANVVTWKHLKDGIKFMSPEQLALAGNKQEQNKLTITSNQYSIGLLLFHILSGELLFDGSGLPSLYEDRVDQKETRTQLNNFYESIRKKLLQYYLSEELADEILKEFIEIYKKLLHHEPADRYQRFEDFISKIEFLKLRIEKEKSSFDGEYLYTVSDSFNSAITVNGNLVDEFYISVMAQLAPKKSMEDKNKRNVRFQYALNYLFTSIPNLNYEAFLEEALSCLVHSLHVDFTIEDYEMFFKLLKEIVIKNTSDPNPKLEEAWKVFNEHSLNAIDTILNPVPREN